MEVTCGSCQKKINIPDEKVPAGKSFKLKCPSCKEEVSVNASATAENIDENDTASGVLICDKDSTILKGVVKQLGQTAHIGKGHDKAKSLMRFNDYHLIIITEEFESLPHDRGTLLEAIQQMKMEKRRHIFVAYITSAHKTEDRMQELALSVDCIISKEDYNTKRDGIAKIIQKRVTEWEQSYKVYKELMITLGKS